MNNKFWAFLIVFIVVIASLSLYTVNQRDRAMLLWLGKLQRDVDTGAAVIKEPGLHIKVPFLHRVVQLDTRIQTMEEPPRRIMTNENKEVIVDVYAKWRIVDLEKFYTSTRGGDYLTANRLLYQRIYDTLRNEFGRRTIQELVSGERVQLMRAINDQAKQSTQDLGIDVLDVRVKRIDLPPEVSSAVYERMRTERERIAREIRARGEADAEIIQAEADATEVRILAEAQRNALEIRAEGDGEAAAIYANSFGQDPEFYSFLRSLESYRETFDQDDNLLVLTPDSDFFKYFNQSEVKSTP